MSVFFLAAFLRFTKEIRVYLPPTSPFVFRKRDEKMRATIPPAIVLFYAERYGHLLLRSLCVTSSRRHHYYWYEKVSFLNEPKRKWCFWHSLLFRCAGFISLPCGKLPTSFALVVKIFFFIKSLQFSGTVRWLGPVLNKEKCIHRYLLFMLNSYKLLPVLTEPPPAVRSVLQSKRQVQQTYSTLIS